MRFKILLVDDEPEFLDLLSEFFTEKDYDVTLSANGAQALDVLKRDHFDIIISDINMPGMKGFELLSQAARIDPKIKRVLITAYDIRDYINHAYKHDIGNIIIKDVPLDLNEIFHLVDNLLRENIFGLEQFFGPAVNKRQITHPGHIEEAITDVIGSFVKSKDTRSFGLALREIVTNAVFYGARREDSLYKNGWDLKNPLPDGKQVTIGWSYDDKKSGVSVLDNSGRLTKRDILYWLNRNMERTSEGFAVGAYDKHGKGLFIARESIDRFLVNIDRGCRTEVILLNYDRNAQASNRPLWIQEI